MNSTSENPPRSDPPAMPHDAATNLGVHAAGAGSSSGDITLLEMGSTAAQDRADEVRRDVEHELGQGITPGEIVDVPEQAALHAGRSPQPQLALLRNTLRAAECP